MQFRGNANPIAARNFAAAVNAAVHPRRPLPFDGAGPADMPKKADIVPVKPCGMLLGNGQGARSFERLALMDCREI